MIVITDNIAPLLTPSFLLSSQEDFYSTALKTLITMSTVVLLGLIVAYHSLEVQVSKRVRGLMNKQALARIGKLPRKKFFPPLPIPFI